MKKKSIIYLAIFLLGGIALTASIIPAQQSLPINKEVQKQETIYTCPMHPELVQDKPGRCPRCGMELIVKKDKQEKMMHIQSDSSKMKHEHMMNDSGSWHHKKMMNDSMMIHHHDHDSTSMMHHQMMNDSSVMKHNHRMK